MKTIKRASKQTGKTKPAAQSQTTAQAALDHPPFLAILDHKGGQELFDVPITSEEFCFIVKQSTKAGITTAEFISRIVREKLNPPVQALNDLDFSNDQAFALLELLVDKFEGMEYAAPMNTDELVIFAAGLRQLVQLTQSGLYNAVKGIHYAILGAPKEVTS